MRRSIPLALLLAAALLPGCSWIKSWGDPEPGDPAPLVEFEQSLEVRRVWSTGIGDGMGKAGLSMGPVFSSGVLFVADYEGRLAAVDAETGRVNWELKTEQPFSGGPGLFARIQGLGNHYPGLQQLLCLLCGPLCPRTRRKPSESGDFERGGRCVCSIRQPARRR